MKNTRHPRAAALGRGRLFSGITSFDELETRIANLGSQQSRNEAFEVFAQAYLATQPVMQASAVWSAHSQLPRNLRDFSDMAHAMDGVVVTKAKEHHAYFTIFCNEGDEVDINGLEDFSCDLTHADAHVIFTNAPDVPELDELFATHYVVSRADLEELQEHDFRAIRAWLQGRVPKRKLKTPRPHQIEALGEIIPSLRKHDRGRILMPCGTGKTMVQLWTAERHKTKTVLVLLPSLALVRQSLHEWLHETSWKNVNFLCVCSDKSVVNGTKDEMRFDQSHLDFPVTNDPARVRHFLQAEVPGVKLVFSTYHSAPIVAAGMPRGFWFDLGVCDEAHETTGDPDGMFAFSLTDENLRIRKRTFWTATQRFYRLPKLEDGVLAATDFDDTPVFSMDDEDVYGPVLHQLSFREAVRRDIICDYEVLVSVVTNDMFGDYELRKGNVIIEDEPVPAKVVADAIALRRAIDEYDVRKIFTFHARVADAQAFVGDGPGSVVRHLPQDFGLFHVNGTMPTAARDAQMTSFRRARRAAVSNAQCLGQGVDVPSVDMVGFFHRKRSMVGIVQATGRAMRKADGKTKGYILVPLYVEQERGERLQDAIVRADYKEVWAVLNALREQDTALAERLRWRRIREGWDDDDTDIPDDDADIPDDQAADDDDGNGDVGPDTPDDTAGPNPDDEGPKSPPVTVVTGPMVDVEMLTDAITTLCVDALTSSWDEMYGRLLRFRKRFGHCNVPSTYERDPKLASWVSNQRNEYKARKLSRDRVERLEAIGFVWYRAESRREAMFAKLVAFKEENGHCNVPSVYEADPELSMWVSGLRKAKKAGTLSQDRIDRLEAIGFAWNVIEARHEEMLAKLVAFKEENGHCHVPNQHEDREFLRWIRNRRNDQKKSKLPHKLFSRLDAIGLPWDTYEAKWEAMFAKLVAFKEENGHCNVPKGYKVDPKLARWVRTQRTRYRRKQLTQKRIDRMEAIGFAWTIR